MGAPGCAWITKSAQARASSRTLPGQAEEARARRASGVKPRVRFLCLRSWWGRKCSRRIGIPGALVQGQQADRLAGRHATRGKILPMEMLERLQRQASAWPEVKLAVLFGSRARGEARPGSDALGLGDSCRSSGRQRWRSARSMGAPGCAWITKSAQAPARSLTLPGQAEEARARKASGVKPRVRFRRIGGFDVDSSVGGGGIHNPNRGLTS